jgi:hypothetical protein
MDENPKLKVIDADAYEKAIRAVRQTGYNAGQQITDYIAQALVDATLSAVGLICPPPKPEKDACTSMLATADGWYQCEDDPGHEGGHDGGDWGWGSNDLNAIAPAEEV